MLKLEKRPGRRDEILPLHTKQGTFSSSVALGLAPARSCLSANAIRFKSLNYHPGNRWESFWRHKTQQARKFSSRFGPARSAPCREEPLVLRTIPGVQDSHSLGLCVGSLGFTRSEEIPPHPLGHTGSAWFGKQNDSRHFPSFFHPADFSPGLSQAEEFAGMVSIRCHSGNKSCCAGLHSARESALARCPPSGTTFHRLLKRF